MNFWLKWLVWGLLGSCLAQERVPGCPLQCTCVYQRSYYTSSGTPRHDQIDIQCNRYAATYGANLSQVPDFSKLASDGRELLISIEQMEFPLLPSYAFANQRIGSLRLLHNPNLRIIEAGVFQFSQLFSLVILDHDKLERIPLDTISELDSLRELALQLRKPIENYQDFSLMNLQNLNGLSLDGLQFQPIVYELSHLRKLRQLSLLNMHLTEELVAAHDNPFKWLESLESLNLGSNAFTSIPGFLYPMIQLRVISLENNRLGLLHNNYQAENLPPNTVSINLMHNIIVWLPCSLFKLKVLEYIKLDTEILCFSCTEQAELISSLETGCQNPQSWYFDKFPKKGPIIVEEAPIKNVSPIYEDYQQPLIVEETEVPTVLPSTVDYPQIIKEEKPEKGVEFKETNTDDDYYYDYYSYGTTKVPFRMGNAVEVTEKTMERIIYPNSQATAEFQPMDERIIHQSKETPSTRKVIYPENSLVTQASGFFTSDPPRFQNSVQVNQEESKMRPQGTEQSNTEEYQTIDYSNTASMNTLQTINPTYIFKPYGFRTIRPGAHITESLMMVTKPEEELKIENPPVTLEELLGNINPEEYMVQNVSREENETTMRYVEESTMGFLSPHDPALKYPSIGTSERRRVGELPEENFTQNVPLIPINSLPGYQILEESRGSSTESPIVEYETKRYSTESPIVEYETKRYSTESPIVEYETKRYSTESPIVEYETKRYSTEIPIIEYEKKGYSTDGPIVEYTIRIENELINNAWSPELEAETVQPNIEQVELLTNPTQIFEATTFETEQRQSMIHENQNVNIYSTIAPKDWEEAGEISNSNHKETNNEMITPLIVPLPNLIRNDTESNLPIDQKFSKNEHHETIAQNQNQTTITPKHEHHSPELLEIKSTPSISKLDEKKNENQEPQQSSSNVDRGEIKAEEADILSKDTSKTEKTPATPIIQKTTEKPKEAKTTTLMTEKVEIQSKRSPIWNKSTTIHIVPLISTTTTTKLPEYYYYDYFEHPKDDASHSIVEGSGEGTE